MRFEKVLARPFAAALMWAFARAAIADPRLDELVYTPYVLNGMAEAEVRTAREVGGSLSGATSSVAEAEYGVDNRLSLALVTSATRAPDSSTRLDSVGFEAVGYVGQIPIVGVDTGLYLEYQKGLGGRADALESKLLLAKTRDRFQGLVNLILERPLGVPPGKGFSAYGYAASATWRTIGQMRLGVESFGDLGSDRAFLGRQGAYVGPQVKWNGRPKGAAAEIEIDAGWLAAVGPARAEAGSQVRLAIEFERHF